MPSKSHVELNRHSEYSNRDAAPTVLGSFRTSITAPSCAAQELSAGISQRERPRSRTGYETLLMDHYIPNKVLPRQSISKGQCGLCGKEVPCMLCINIIFAKLEGVSVSAWVIRQDTMPILFAGFRRLLNETPRAWSNGMVVSSVSRRSVSF